MCIHMRELIAHTLSQGVNVLPHLLEFQPVNLHNNSALFARLYSLLPHLAEKQSGIFLFLYIYIYIYILALLLFIHFLFVRWIYCWKMEVLQQCHAANGCAALALTSAAARGGGLLLFWRWQSRPFCDGSVVSVLSPQTRAASFASSGSEPFMILPLASNFVFFFCVSWWVCSIRSSVRLPNT